MSFDFRSIQVLDSTPVLRALQILDCCGSQIVLVVDGDERLLGVLTDGDIRRSLLKGETLDSPVVKFMNKNFRFASQTDNNADVLLIMRRESILQLPVLNLQGRVVNLLFLHQLLEPTLLDNPVVIMAGGMGKRLRPYTENCPKPMLLINGKPMLEILIEQFKATGFNQFYISVNYLKDQIISLFKLFPTLKKNGLFIIEELDFPDTRKDMNENMEKNTLYNILNLIIKKKDFKSRFISEKEKKFFLKNLKKIDILKGRFNKIAFVRKR